MHVFVLFLSVEMSKVFKAKPEVFSDRMEDLSQALLAVDDSSNYGSALVFFWEVAGQSPQVFISTIVIAHWIFSKRSTDQKARRQKPAGQKPRWSKAPP